ncbi:unnamed protein product [Ixodes hexagonus]
MPFPIERTCLRTNCGSPVKTGPRSKFGACPKCRHVTCFACQAIHEGVSCMTFQESKKPSPPKRNTERSDAVPDALIVDGEARQQAEPGIVTLPAHAAGSPKREEDSAQKTPDERAPVEELLAVCESGSCKFQAFLDGSAKQLCCPNCHNVTCLRCKAVHEFSTCQEYQAQKNAAALALELQEQEAVAAAVEPLECLPEPLQPEEPRVPCCVCKTEKLEIQIAEMRPCSHQVCLNCVEGGARQSPTYLVRCPVKGSDGGRCHSYVHESLLRRVLPEDVYLRHKSLMGLPLQSCATENCSGKFSILRDMKTATCLDCQRVNCVPCKAIHESKTCEEYLQEVVARLDGRPVQEPDVDDRNNEKIECATAGCEGIGRVLAGNRQTVWCSRCKQVTCLRCEKIHTVDVCPYESDVSSGY